MSAFILRPMAVTDLPAVAAVQALCYGPALIESESALGSRLALAPDLCWVAEPRAGEDSPPGSRDGLRLGGYLLTHPWPSDSLPAWNGLLPPEPAGSARPSPVWFIHDLAVAPAAQHCGLAHRLYQSARERAILRGLLASRLIAVQSAAHWWRRLGYAPVPPQDLSAPVAAGLAGYGDDASLMHCALDAAPQHPRTGPPMPPDA